MAARLASLHWHTSLISSVGDDRDGKWIRETAAAHDVDVSMVEVHPRLPTSTVSIELDVEGGHRFTINRPIAWDDIKGPTHLPEHDVLNFGTLGIRDERSRRALTRLLAMSDAKRVVDLNLREPDFNEDVVSFVLSHADIAKMSDEELPIVARLLRLPPTPEALFELGPEWLCVTRGADGAELHHTAGETWDAPGSATEVVDTVGAGDAFLAGLVDGLFRTGDGLSALEAAQLQALQAVGQRGGLPAIRA